VLVTVIPLDVEYRLAADCIPVGAKIVQFLTVQADAVAAVPLLLK
jgi:hypothetical protein